MKIRKASEKTTISEHVSALRPMPVNDRVEYLRKNVTEENEVELMGYCRAFKPDMSVFERAIEELISTSEGLRVEEKAGVKWVYYGKLQLFNIVRYVKDEGFMGINHHTLSATIATSERHFFQTTWEEELGEPDYVRVIEAGGEYDYSSLVSIPVIVMGERKSEFDVWFEGFAKRFIDALREHCIKDMELNDLVVANHAEHWQAGREEVVWRAETEERLDSVSPW